MRTRKTRVSNPGGLEARDPGGREVNDPIQEILMALDDYPHDLECLLERRENRILEASRDPGGLKARYP